MRHDPGPFFKGPKLCAHCQRRHDAAHHRFRRAFVSWMKRRQAEAADRAQELAALPSAERRAIVAAEMKEARIELRRRIAERQGSMAAHVSRRAAR